MWSGSLDRIDQLADIADDHGNTSTYMFVESIKLWEKKQYRSVKQQKLYKSDEKQWLTWKRKIHAST